MHRSYLFIPGNNPAMLQNALIFGSDAIILDLEDAVSIQEKDAARWLITHYLETLSNPHSSIYVRINQATTRMGAEDLKMVLCDHIEGIVLPKATVQDVRTLTKLLQTFEHAKRMKTRLKIVPIIETAKAVVEMEAIASEPRVSGLLLGAEDLTQDMEIERTKTGVEIEYPRSKMAYTCKANGIEAIDTPFTDTNDDTGFDWDARHALQLGMSGKCAIHPNQIDLINQTFAPSPSQIRYAKRIIEADLQAQSVHRGVFSLDGKMVDKPVVERAKKLLEKAARYQLVEVDDNE